MKIKDILSLNYSVIEDYHSIEEDVLYIITDDICSGCIRIDDMENVEVRQYIKQRNFGDNRARYLYCIYYKENPVFLYQYVGRGEYRNIIPLKCEMYTEFKQKVIEKYIKELPKLDTKQYDLDYDIEVNTYGNGYEIKDNEIHVHKSLAELNRW